MRKVTIAFLLAITVTVMCLFTACDNEWDSAIKKTIKELSSDNANYSMSTICLYALGLPQERGYKEKLFSGSGKYYTVRTDLDGGNEETGQIYTGNYSLVREDYGNDLIYQAMLLGSIIGKSDYFTNEDGKYTLLNERKEEIASRIFEFTTNFNIVKDMYYVISGGKVTEYYVLIDRTSDITDSIQAPMSISLVFEYGNVTI